MPPSMGAPSQPCGLGSPPGDAAVQQQRQAAVGEVAEAMLNALDLLDQQVQGPSGPVGAAAGGVEGKDLGLPCPDRAGQARQFRYPDAIAPAVEACQRPPSCDGTVGGVDGPQPQSSPLGELLGGGQQQLADAVQRVVGAAPVPGRGLLGPSPDLVDHRVGQPDGVEVVDHDGGVPRRDEQRTGIPAPWIQRDRGDACQPVAGPDAEPAVHRSSGAIGHQVQQPAAPQVHQAGHEPGRRHPGGLQEAGLVQPERGPGPACHSVRSRPAPPRSGPPAATRRPPPPRRGPRSPPDQAAWRPWHYRVDPPAHAS